MDRLNFSIEACPACPELAWPVCGPPGGGLFLQSGVCWRVGVDGPGSCRTRPLELPSPAVGPQWGASRPPSAGTWTALPLRRPSPEPVSAVLLWRTQGCRRCLVFLDKASWILLAWAPPCLVHLGVPKGHSALACLFEGAPELTLRASHSEERRENHDPNPHTCSPQPESGMAPTPDIMV